MAEAQEVFPELVSMLTDRRPDYQEYYSYYSGEQGLPILNAEFRSRFGALFDGFNDNLARPIIEAADARVRVVEFQDPDAQSFWRANRLKKESKWVHEEAMVKGDAYVIVLPKADGSPGIWPQITDSCAVLYDMEDPRDKVAGIKYWIEDMLPPEGSTQMQPYCRVNLYFPDRIERYVSKAQTDNLVLDFDKYAQYTGDGSWRTTHKVGQVPLFQFSPDYDINTGRGRSDLADSIGIIGAINKEFLDMMVSSEYTAAPQRYATGVEIPLDPKTGKPLEAYKSGANQLWTAPNEAARFGQFSAGDLQAYVEAISVLVEHLASTSATPVHTLMSVANYPNGEQLKAAEMGLRSRVQDHQDDFGTTWAEVMAAALYVAEVDEVAPEDLEDLEPTWLPANAPYATRERMEEIKVKAEVAGIPEEMLWRELGYTADEIEEMKAMREDEALLGPDLAALSQAEAIIGGAPPATTEAGLANDVLPTDESSPLTNP